MKLTLQAILFLPCSHRQRACGCAVVVPCVLQSTTLKNVMCLKNAKITALLALVVLVGG